MSLLSKIGDALLHLIGLRKDPTPPPHADYANPYMGYFYPTGITIRGVGSDFDSALSRVCVELNRGAREAKLPYLFSSTIAANENILVQWDNNGKVEKGEDGITPPLEIQGSAPATPWQVVRASVYVRRGKSGDYLYTLLLHEIFAHARTGMGRGGHSTDPRDVGYPDAKNSRLSPADIATWAKCEERRHLDYPT